MRTNLKAKQLPQKKYNDARVTKQTCEFGDVEYRLNEKRAILLKLPWEGPYLVVKVNSPVLLKKIHWTQTVYGPSQQFETL